jgi:DNA-binding MarR family transcriptional regulator
VACLGEQVRRMGAQSVLSKTVAARFGLNTGDLECLDLIYLRGQASAGELARAMGLTSGAVTALIDRLERAGNVERTDGPADRRRREVRILPEAIKHKVILDFVLRSTDLSVELH